MLCVLAQGLHAGAQWSMKCHFLSYLPSPGSPWQALQQCRQHYSKMWRYKGACLLGNWCHCCCSLGFHLPGLGLQSFLGNGYQLLHVQPDATLCTCTSNRKTVTVPWKKKNLIFFFFLGGGSRGGRQKRQLQVFGFFIILGGNAWMKCISQACFRQWGEEFLPVPFPDTWKVILWLRDQIQESGQRRNLIQESGQCSHHASRSPSTGIKYGKTALL